MHESQILQSQMPAISQKQVDAVIRLSKEDVLSIVLSNVF